VKTIKLLEFTEASFALAPELLSFISKWAKENGYKDAYIKNGATIMGEPVTQVFAEKKFEDSAEEFVASMSMKG
jgi:hypothetical protein